MTTARQVWGQLPIVHIAIGSWQADGRYRLGRARGIIALSDIAIGLVAVGGSPFGLLCVGGVALGLVAVGAVAVGLAAVGAVSIGLLAVGAVAIGHVRRRGHGRSRRRPPPAAER